MRMPNALNDERIAPRTYALCGFVEYRERFLTCAFDLATAEGGQPRPDDAIVLRLEPVPGLIAQPLDHLGRLDDLREQERQQPLVHLGGGDRRVRFDHACKADAGPECDLSSETKVYMGCSISNRAERDQEGRRL